MNVMPSEAGINQKLKMLILARIFYDRTDEEHPITVYELSDMLAAEGVSANRKTLYNDIALLCDYGLDIITVPCGKSNGYYLAQREFELAELKLLADAVSSARFITEHKSRTLLKKLERLAGQFKGQELNRRVYVANRIKSDNEQIYINVDAIQRAIEQKCMISFKYFDYTVSKRKQYRDGQRICAPYALAWNDGNYYMVAYYEKYPETLSNFRVDRMDKIKILSEAAVMIPESFDLAEYLNTSFSMFSGVSDDIKLRFDDRFINAVTDKFGTDVMIIPNYDGTFTVCTKIKPGAAFYGWLFQFGTGAEIISPKEIREEFEGMIKSIETKYEKKGADND